MGSALSGSQTTKSELPSWVESYAKDLLARAQDQSKVGYMPFTGPVIAGYDDRQITAMQNTDAAATALGMASAPVNRSADPMSAIGPYDQAIAGLEARAPGQVAAYSRQWIDPASGQLPGATQAVPVAPAAPTALDSVSNGNAWLYDFYAAPSQGGFTPGVMATGRRFGTGPGRGPGQTFNDRN